MTDKPAAEVTRRQATTGTGFVRPGYARARDSVPDDIAGTGEDSGLPKWQRAFCEALIRNHAVVLLACEVARVSKPTAYRWRKASRAFREAWDAAVDQGRAEEEFALYSAAVHGDFEPFYDGGKIVGYWRRRSVKAMQEILKRRLKPR